MPRWFVVGLILIGAGLVVFRYSADIAGQLDSHISPPPDAGNVTGLMSPGGWYLPYPVWGFRLHADRARRDDAAQRVHVRHDGWGRGRHGGWVDVSPNTLETYMQQALSTGRGSTGQQETSSSMPKEVVKVKCRNCGNLEMEDAAYCRKSGQPL